MIFSFYKDCGINRWRSLVGNCPPFSHLLFNILNKEERINFIFYIFWLIVVFNDYISSLIYQYWLFSTSHTWFKIQYNALSVYLYITILCVFKCMYIEICTTTCTYMCNFNIPTVLFSMFCWTVIKCFNADTSTFTMKNKWKKINAP